MDFVRSHFGKMNLRPVEHFFEHICHHFWVGLLLLVLMLKKVFNWSEFHLSEVTSYKIHTLMIIFFIYFRLWTKILLQKKSAILIRTVLLQMIVSNRNVLIQDIVEMPLSHSSVISNFIDAYQVESIYDTIFNCLQVTTNILLKVS